MNTRTKAKILSDLYITVKAHEAWADFLKWADLGVPLAMAVEYGLAMPSKKGLEMIDETYAMLLKVLEVPDRDYQDLSELFDASSKRPS